MRRRTDATTARSSVYDVAVVGLGAVGSAALFALARQGVRAIGIDRFHPPHGYGSSHGETRITRQAIGEGEAYVPLVLRSNAILESLEAETGQELLERCGFLLIARGDEDTTCHGKAGFLATTAGAARNFSIPHEILESSELSRRFPQFANLSGNERAYYEPGGGMIRPERCIEQFLRRAAMAGAAIRTDSPVEAINPVGQDFEVRSVSGNIAAHRVIIATGAWISQLAPRSVAPHVRIYRQSLHWFPLIDNSDYRHGAMPTFYWGHGPTVGEQFYGFPPIDGRLKVATEQYQDEWNPDDLSREVEPDEAQQMMRQHVRGRLSGIGLSPVQSKACLYTVTTDYDFLLSDDEYPGFFAVSACSGHGFKHAPAVGEAVAALALGSTPKIDISCFRRNRLLTG